MRAMSSRNGIRRGNGPLADARRWSVAMALLALGCPSLRDTVNANPGLRWWLFTNFGAPQICPHVLDSSVPLRSSPGNTQGRFFPKTCRYEVDGQRHTIRLHFAGTGYSWFPVAGRVGFEASAGVEYRMDFQMAEEAMYLWASPSSVTEGPDFQLASVENPLVDWASRNPGAFLAQAFGGELMSSRLGEGFTVIHTDQGNEFALGHLSPPARPARPFDTSGSRRFVFFNETTEIRANQVDFIGPLEVPRAGQALYFRFRVQGPAVDAALFTRQAADTWRESVQRGLPLSAPLQAPVASWTIPASIDSPQRVTAAPGKYVLVIDNGSTLGAVAPPWNPLASVGGSAAVVSFTAEVGDANP